MLRRHAVLMSIVVLGLPLAAGAQLVPFGKNAAPADPTPHVDLEVIADAEAIAAGGRVTVGFAFTVDEDWHIYWRNHGASGMAPRIDWELPEGFTAGPIRHPAPKTYTVEFVGTTYIHEGRPMLLADITAPADAPVGESVDIKGEAHWLVCQKSCLPGEQTFSLTLPVVAAGTTPKRTHEDRFEAARDRLPVAPDKAKYANVSAKISVDRVRPKDEFEAAVVLDVKERFYIQSNKPQIEGLIATEVFLDSHDGLETGDPKYPQHKIRESSIGKLAVYDGQVVVRIPVEADSFLSVDSSRVSGVVTFQTCDEKGSCFPPESVEWSVDVPFAKADEKVSAINASIFGAVPDADPGVAEPTDEPPARGGFNIDAEINVQESGKDYPFWLYIIMALAGGLFLNITPCVLPVISIKILSFVQQAGENPARVKTLNLVFSAGLLSVFVILATLARFFGYGWGELFTHVSFNIVLATVVFAMGLSFFGVFEIPVPGWVNNAGGVEREGLPGAFLKGILATLLATPCAGPLMGVVLAWSVAQTAAVTYLVWLCIGLGMASPYLLAAVNPNVIKWLPKPGMWMERVKQFMGFLLMGTTVYFLYVLPDTHVIWTSAFLVVVGMACWMLGQLVNINSSPLRKVVVRGSALALAVVAGVLAFQRFIPGTVDRAERGQQFAIDEAYQRGIEEGLRIAGGDTTTVEPKRPIAERGSEDPHLPWMPFSLERLGELTAQGKTVLVDFTADWCPNCKYNEATALNTAETKALVDENRVACLLADYTQRPPEIKRLLNKLGSISVPLTAIFPAERPNEPIILRDIFTKTTLLEKLREAGPSLSAVAQATNGEPAGE